MGVDINFNNLQQLFSAAQAFGMKIDAIQERIQMNINKISNPAFTDGMTGGQGDEAIKALARGREALESLLESIRTTRQFIDRKLGGANAMKIDKQGFGEQNAKMRSQAENLKMKRS